MPSLHPPGVPLIKGAAIREFFLWYERTHGAEAARDTLEGLGPDLARLVEPSLPAFGLLASTWYPAPLVHHFLDRVARGASDEGRELARVGNRDVVPRMVRGIYKVIYRTVASPELYARHVARQWKTLHSTGERSFVLRGPGEALSVLADWPAHHPVLCWVTIYTMVSLFEAMGFEAVTAERIRCAGHGGADCATVLRWR